MELHKHESIIIGETECRDMVELAIYIGANGFHRFELSAEGKGQFHLN